MRGAIEESGYRRWLAGMHRDRVVGRAADCWSCPLSSYLKALGAEYAEVRSGSYIAGDKRRRLPVWAKRHIARVDAQGVWSKITAGAALAALDAGAE